MAAHRLRLLALLGVLLTTSVLAIWWDSRVARVVVVLLAVGSAVVLGNLGTTWKGQRRSLVEEDRDVVAEDRDQAADRRDEVADQRDQVADQRDQAAGQRDQDAGIRDSAAGIRDSAAGIRDNAAGIRDNAADQRDQVADKRDTTGEERDVAGEQAGAGSGGGTTRADLSGSILVRREAASDRRLASQDRGAGAVERTAAEHDRETALTDRGASASERTHAEHERETALTDRGASASERTHAEFDRDAALADRGASAGQREYASVDGLTHVYLRSAGFVELAREIARARGTEQPLVLAFVDVDHLEAINESRGHAAGDRMLLEVATTLGATLRPYDLIFRYGDDEFVCALSGLTMADAAKRLALVNAALAEAPEQGTVTVGLAELQPDEPPEDLVARADAARRRGRQ